MSTPSSILGLTLIGNGEQAGTWGTTTNTNLQILEQGIGAIHSVDLTSGNVTLTYANGVLNQEAHGMTIVATGTPGTVRNIVAPMIQKTYVVSNQTTGGFAVTFKAPSGVGTVSVPNGATVLVYGDGSTGYYACGTGSAGNFTVGSNLSVVGTGAVTGAFSAGATSITGNLTATGTVNATGGFTGALASGTGATGTWSISISGNAATATTATTATNATTVGGYSVGQNLLTSSNVTFANLTSTGALAQKAPTVVSTQTYTVTATDVTILMTYTAAGMITITLPTAASYSGRVITVMSMSTLGTPKDINSASANVGLVDGTTGIAIVNGGSAIAPRWATLQSTGSVWQIIARGG